MYSIYSTRCDVTLGESDLVPETHVPSASVLVGIDLDPPRQGRLSVFFRGVLVIPLAILVAIVAIAAYVVVILSWFAAMVTGRVPASFHRFLTSFQRFAANVSAYEFLLVARWPGINFTSRADEQVSVEITNVKQRRLSIFFRGLLAYPAGFLGLFWNFAHSIVMVVMWVWVLIRGQAPRSLHHYGALWMRYNVRLSSYSLLLTPDQPWHGMRGDGVALKESPQEVPTPETSPGNPTNVEFDAAPPAPFDESTTGPTKVFHWNVTNRASTLVTWSVPIGVVLVAAYVTVIVVVVSGRVSETSQVTKSYNTSFNAGQAFSASVSQCQSVACINQLAATAARGERRAESYLTDSFSGTSVQFARYDKDLRDLNADYSAMSREQSVTALRATVLTWKADFVQAQTDVNVLLRALA
jgi:hypothetical protein